MAKILVIEDHQDVRENICEILELSDYDVFEASNGKEGVRIAIAELPDLIICDIMMPELDGYGVIHILNKKSETRDIPFIFLSAKSEKTDFRKGMNLGADDYLTKPFDDKELLQAVELRLQKRKSSGSGETSVNSGFHSEKKLEEALKHLTENSEERVFNKKDIIFSEGERSYFLYQLKQGSIKLFKTHDDGKEVILKLVKPGEFFGYLSAVKDGFFSESATALERSSILHIPRTEFMQSLYEKPELSAYLIKLLAENVTEAEERLMNMAYNSVRKKVAEALLFVKRQKQSKSDENTINILRDDLAGIAGTAKETAIRALADFREEGLIKIEDRNIIILDLERLENLPN